MRLRSNSLRNRIRTALPEPIRKGARIVRNTFKRNKRTRARITEPTGTLRIEKAQRTFLAVVGSAFDQTIPNAMMTCRMGYCNAFESLGIPYLIVDWRDLDVAIEQVNNPFAMVFGSDYAEMSAEAIEQLRPIPKCVWVNPWFEGSERFFNTNGLDAKNWIWTCEHTKKILDSKPNFTFTATVDEGIGFFQEWEKHGCETISLPLACDTTLYNTNVPLTDEFSNVDIAFVGGYWKSKGEQIDRYLRPFESSLTVYGYSPWPYARYGGLLARELEPALYRQAKVSPTINEPTVKLLHGQINERIFKVLGSGGVTVVDAVPAYRSLFSKDELPIPSDERDFANQVKALLNDESLRIEYSKRGRRAVLDRHTYRHRALQVINQLGIVAPN